MSEAGLTRSGDRPSFSCCVRTFFLVGLVSIVTFVLNASAPTTASAVESRVPSWGIVVTPDHEVYFTDRYCEGGCIWKWSEASGLAKAVEGRNSSTLVLHEGLLYYSNTEMVSAAEGFGAGPDHTRSALYRLNADLVEETVVDTTSDPLVFSGLDFLLAEDETLYFFHRGRMQRRNPDGTTETFLGEWRQGLRDGTNGEGVRFNSVRGMAWTPEGEIVVVDGQRLRHINLEERSVDTFGRGITEKVPDDPAFRGTERGDWNRTYGITVSDEGDLYIAYHGNRRLLRHRKRKLTDAYHAPGPWTPVGVALQGEAIYVLETAHSGERSWGPRVRRIADGRVETIATVE